jgi:hypothetical protein
LAKKYPIHKHYSLDNEVCEQWEGLVKSQGKSYSEKIEEYMSKEVDRLNENSAIAFGAAALSTTLTPNEEFEQTISGRIEPLLTKDNSQITIEDKSILDSILISTKKLVGTIETKFNRLRVVNFSKIAEYDRLEKTRLAQLKSAKEYQEKKERYNLMQELPLPILVQEEEDKAKIETLSEAQLWALQQSEERRQRKLRTPDRTQLTAGSEVVNEEINEE